MTPAKKASPEIVVRIASAVVLVPTVLWIILQGGGWFLVLLSIAIALLAIEWAMMTTPGLGDRLGVAISLSVLAPVFLTYLGHPVLGFDMLAFGAVSAGLYAHRLKVSALDIGYGVLYIGIPAIVLIWLSGTGKHPEGALWVMFVFVVVWVTDSAAYIFGKLIKGPKLWPRYSPNKTWSGFASGLVIGMLAAGRLSDLTHVFKTSTGAQMVGLICALATMAGDLWESMLKRRYGVKDTGQLIPGHGGLLDRVDGLMFAILAIGAIRFFSLLGHRLDV